MNPDQTDQNLKAYLESGPDWVLERWTKNHIFRRSLVSSAIVGQSLTEALWTLTGRLLEEREQRVAEAVRRAKEGPLPSTVTR